MNLNAPEMFRLVVKPRMANRPTWVSLFLFVLLTKVGMFPLCLDLWEANYYCLGRMNLVSASQSLLIVESILTPSLLVSHSPNDH